MFHSNVILKFWDECVKIIMFLINRTPSLMLNSKFPFEILYDK